VTLFDCDEFVWSAALPFGVSSANVGTQLIARHQTYSIVNAFKTMSLHNRAIAVLVAWRDKPGTRNWYKLAGFLSLLPQEKQEYRRYRFSIIGDSENITLKCEPSQGRMATLP